MSRTCSLVLLLAGLLGSCSSKESSAAAPSASSTSPAAAAMVAAMAPMEAGCGSCVFAMADVKGCQLAVKVDGKPYLVSGVEMPGHESGLCDGPKTAMFAGKVEGDRFVAASFSLKP